jgi:hypothetical protein
LWFLELIVSIVGKYTSSTGLKQAKKNCFFRKADEKRLFFRIPGKNYQKIIYFFCFRTSFFQNLLY